MTTELVRVQARGGTFAQLTAENAVPLEREIVVAFDTPTVWIGDGTRTLSQLQGFTIGSGSSGGGSGSGLPAGGTTGQVLAKNSGTAGDAIWKTLVAALITDAGAAGQAVLQKGTVAQILAYLFPTPGVQLTDLSAALQSQINSASGTSARAPKVDVIPYAATITPDASLGNVKRVTATGNMTINAPSNPAEAQTMVFEILSSGGAFTTSLQTGVSQAFAFGTDVTAIPAGVSGKTQRIYVTYRSSTSRWEVVDVLNGF